MIRWQPWLLTAVLCGVCAGFGLTGPDTPAQEYRVWLFEHGGAVLWDDQWYGGHTIPGYSVLFPPLGALLGLQLLGSLACVASTVFATRLLRGPGLSWAQVRARLAAGAAGRGGGGGGPPGLGGGPVGGLASRPLRAGTAAARAVGAGTAAARAAGAGTAASGADTKAGHAQARFGHDLALVWFAVATVANLVVGRLPFALGMAFGALALVGVRERRSRLAWAGTICSSLASPLAGGFMLLVGLALLGSLGVRRVVPFVGAGSGIVVALAFPEEGFQPFPAVTYLSLLTLVVIGMLVVPREQVAIRRGLMLWLAAATFFFFVPTQIGGNIARPATLLAGPLAAMLLAHRPRVLLLVAVPLVGWQIGPVHGAFATHGDPSADPEYYTELLDYLDSGPVPAGRVEIPFTRSHWEAAFAAPSVPLARGWLRQLDSKYNSLFYDGTLTAETYREWLTRRGIRYVALPDVPLDASAVAEAELLRSGLPYLEIAWKNENWTVWLFTESEGLVRGPAELTELGVSSIEVTFREPGMATVLVHYTPYWQLSDGSEACVFRAADGWTGILTESAGPVRLSARLSVDGLIRSRALDCPADTRLH